MIESLRIRGRRITVRLGGFGRTLVQCSLARIGGGLHRVKQCVSGATFRHVRPGVYRVRISSSAGAFIRRVTVR
jgi:hypothetical protein